VRKNILIVVIATFLFSALFADEYLVDLGNEENTIEVIDRDVAKKLGLFGEYENFKEAKIYITENGEYVLEVFYRDGAKKAKKRKKLDLTEVVEIKRNIASLGIKKLDHEGRARFLIGTTALTLGYYGWAPQAAATMDSSGYQKIVLSSFLLLSGASFYVPYVVTKEINVTDAAASLSIYGGSRGMVHGWLISNLLVGTSVSETKRWQYRLIGGWLVGGFEYFSGFNLGNNGKMSAGKAELIGVGGDFGLIQGFMAAYMAGFMDDDINFPLIESSSKMEADGGGAYDVIRGDPDDSDSRLRLTSGFALAGAGAGIFAGALLGDSENYTRGDSDVLWGAGILGLWAPLAIVDFTGTKSSKTYIASSMAGNMLALGIGSYILKKEDFSKSDGVYILLSELAGGLIGAGLVHMAVPEGSNESRYYLTASTIGAFLGFGGMYYLLKGKKEDEEREKSWSFSFNPQGLIIYGLNRKNEGKIPFSGEIFSFKLDF